MNAAPVMSSLLNPELAEYRRQVLQVKELTAALVQGLSNTQFNWQPAPGRWSIAQCLAHVIAGNEVYFPAIQASITRAREKGLTGDGPFHHGRIGNWFVRTMDAPPKRRMRNPKRITPLPDQRLAKCLAEFNANHDRILELIDAANGVDLGRAAFRSPFFKLLKLSLGQAIAVMPAHARRHLWQANEVRKHPDFPKA